MMTLALARCATAVGRCGSISLSAAVVRSHTQHRRTMATQLLDIDTPVVSLDESRRFMRDCLVAAGTPDNHATSHAALLAEADYRGHYSHGLNRLEMYVNDIQAGTCDPCAEPYILRETPATALIDGRNGLGAVVGNYCMDLAMRKAKVVGVGIVSVNNSNHFGIAGWYTLQAVNEGLIGFSFCNTSPFLTPTRAVDFIGRLSKVTDDGVFLLKVRHGLWDPLFQDTPVVSLDESRRFMRDCLVAAGTPDNHATSHAALLAEADYRGHYSHGLNRLEMYVNDIQAGTCDPCAEPYILRETPATALIDGRNGLGAVVGNYCMDLAMRKAKVVGVGIVSVNNSNHFGIAGWYTLQAVNEGLIGFSFCNTSPFLTPTRAVDAALGTNPISFAAPGLNGDNLVLDMATTAVAVGKIEMQRRKGVGIPAGWALDSQGRETQDSEEAYQAARLMPLGGDELHSGYKGFGLAVMVETLCGILSGSKYGPNIRKWGNTTDKADLGQCFIAINPDCFAPGFPDHMSDLMNSIRSMKPAEVNKPVLMAGDPERQHMAAVDVAGGVRYLSNQWDTCKSLAARLNVTPMRPVSCTPVTK